MRPYRWATNPGSRVEPPDTMKATGFVPAVPAGAGTVNDVVGRALDLVAGLPTTVVPLLQPRWVYDPGGPAIAPRTYALTGTSDELLSSICALDDEAFTAGRPRLLFGYVEDDATDILHAIRVDLMARTQASPVTVVTANLGAAGFAFLGPGAGGDTTHCFYHSGDTVQVKSSTDDGATWSSAVEAWDLTDSGATTPGFLPGHLWPLRLRSGRILLAAAVTQDDPGPDEDQIRYVYSDDDGATWETNTGAGWVILSGTTAKCRPVMWEALDGRIWTVAAGRFDDLGIGLYYQVGVAPGLPDPADPESLNVIDYGATLSHTPTAAVVDDSGGVALLGWRDADPVWHYQSVMLRTVGDTLRLVGVEPTTVTAGGSAVAGAACVGLDGGVYVATLDEIFEFDCPRQPLPEVS